MNWAKFFPPDGADATAMQYFGLLGDYIGGVWGTAIGLLTLVAVFFTWRSSRRAEYRAKSYQVFTEMMRTHEEIVASIQINDLKGREAIAAILSEFYTIYLLTKKIVPDYDEWDVDERIDVAWTYTFFGPQLHTQKVLKGYREESIRKLGDEISKERAKLKAGDKRTFSGHQNRLSQYFRNLFSAYAFIDGSYLDSNEKSSLAKVLRSKLSNYEQAILVLNAIAHLGSEWERLGLLVKYKPFKNVPEHFFSFDDKFGLKTRFPYIDFEWESRGLSRIKSNRLSVGAWDFVILRRGSRDVKL